MISIAELIKDNQTLKGNYFNPHAYFKGDFESGLIENSQGSRLIVIPEVLLQGIYAGLEQEVGQATGIVLFKCGYRWGKNFYRRFVEEVSQYYGKTLANMEMIEFLQCFKQCWKTHGWGVLDLNFEYYQQGFIVAFLHNSPFAENAGSTNYFSCYAEAGMLSAFFSQLTGRELHCIQTACEIQGADQNAFVIGLENRIKPATAWLGEGQDHQTIMQRLAMNQP